MEKINIFNNDCLEEMKNIKDKSVDLIFTDLPYGEIACKWDSCIDLDLMWKQFKRIRKDTTPIIFTCSTKFGYKLIESNKKEYRYDMVWIKSSPAGFLNSKRMPMKKHEMVYVFYKKCPSETYGNNIKKYHKHKFLDDKYIDKNNKNKNTLYRKVKKQLEHPREATYNPPLPNSIIKEDYNTSNSLYGEVDIPKYKNRKERKSCYNPALPNSILEISSQKGKHSTQKPTQLSDFFIKYYSNENDIVLDCCMGSGSTGISCKNLNRRFIGIEKNEEIFNVAKNRLL